MILDLPLAGIRVLDLTRVLSGPFCSMVLADLGADVVKVKPTPSGDMIRAWGPYDQIKMEALKDGCVRRPSSDAG